MNLFVEVSLVCGVCGGAQYGAIPYQIYERIERISEHLKPYVCGDQSPSNIKSCDGLFFTRPNNNLSGQCFSKKILGFPKAGDSQLSEETRQGVT